MFSYVDHVLTSKPNVKTLALEAQIKKSSRGENRNTEEVILAKRIEKQQEQFLMRQQIEGKRIERTTDMLFYGLWQSATQVDKKLSEIKTTGEKEALKHNFDSGKMDFLKSVM